MPQAGHRPALSEEEFLAWRQHPVTEGLIVLLRGRIDGLKERWAAGQFTDPSQFGTAILNAEAIGECKLCEVLIALDFEQFHSELYDDEQHERAPAPGSSSLAGTL